MGGVARYRAEASGEIVLHPLDAITLIYHRRSGQTHMVVPPVPEILAVMAGDVLDAAAVHERLAALYDLGGEEEATAVIAARLEELAALGLVAPESGGGA